MAYIYIYICCHTQPIISVCHVLEFFIIGRSCVLHLSCERVGKRDNEDMLNHCVCIHDALCNGWSIRIPSPAVLSVVGFSVRDTSEGGGGRVLREKPNRLPCYLFSALFVLFHCSSTEHFIGVGKVGEERQFRSEVTDLTVFTHGDFSPSPCLS